MNRFTLCRITLCHSDTSWCIHNLCKFSFLFFLFFFLFSIYFGDNFTFTRVLDLIWWSVSAAWRHVESGLVSSLHVPSIVLLSPWHLTSSLNNDHVQWLLDLIPIQPIYRNALPCVTRRVELDLMLTLLANSRLYHVCYAGRETMNRMRYSKSKLTGWCWIFLSLFDF